MTERLNYRCSWQITKQWLISVLATILVAVVSSVLAFKLLETRIARNFKIPDIGTVPGQVQSPGNYDFTYTSLNGQRHNLSELRGKVVFANFWGTWCIRCVAEMPTIEKLYDNLKGDPALVF
jgi:thiol-disulfide isomerase/thioredoxin